MLGPKNCRKNPSGKKKSRKKFPEWKNVTVKNLEDYEKNSCSQNLLEQKILEARKKLLEPKICRKILAEKIPRKKLLGPKILREKS